MPWWNSKVSALIAQRTDDGQLIVLGTGQRESKGVKRGYVADMASTEIAIREAVEQAERLAGTNIEDVWVSFSAGGHRSNRSTRGCAPAQESRGTPVSRSAVRSSVTPSRRSRETRWATTRSAE